jgi:hypothetical protein
MVSDPAFGDAEFVGDLLRVQKTVIVLALLGGDLVQLVKVVPYALDSEFDLWLSRGFNHRMIAGTMVYRLFAG